MSKSSASLREAERQQFRAGIASHRIFLTLLSQHSAPAPLSRMFEQAFKNIDNVLHKDAG